MGFGLQLSPVTTVKLFTCFLQMKHPDQSLPGCDRDIFGPLNIKVVRINVTVLWNIQKSDINDQSLYLSQFVFSMNNNSLPGKKKVNI